MLKRVFCSKLGYTYYLWELSLCGPKKCLNCLHKYYRNQKSSLSIVTVLGLEHQGSIHGTGNRFLCMPQCPALNVGPTNSPIQWVPGLFRSKVAGVWSWPLTSIWCWIGAIPSLPHVFIVWCLIKHNNNLIFTFELNLPPWPESVSELYLPSESCLSAKLVQTFVDRGNLYLTNYMELNTAREATRC
jgi:hypothetical protein